MSDDNSVELGALFRTFNVGWASGYRWSGLDQMIALVDGIDRSGYILQVKTPQSAREFADVCDGRATMLEWADKPEIADHARDLRDKLLRAADEAEANGQTEEHDK